MTSATYRPFVMGQVIIMDPYHDETVTLVVDPASYYGADLWTAAQVDGPRTDGVCVECNQPLSSTTAGVLFTGVVLHPACGLALAAAMGKHPLGLLLQSVTLAPTDAAIFIATQSVLGAAMELRMSQGPDRYTQLCGTSADSALVNKLFAAVQTYEDLMCGHATGQPARN